MDIPKISNIYNPTENPVPEILGSNNKNGNGGNNSFSYDEDKGSADHRDSDKNFFFESYTKDSSTLIVSTNEWLGTWRPLI